jgi:hypothetical protein
MLSSKRRIPRLGFAALAFGGCSDDPNNVNVDLTPIVTPWCTELEVCDETGFALSFGTQAGCINELSDAIDEGAEFGFSHYGQACVDAFLDYYECISAGYGASCDDDYVHADYCMEAGLARDAACGGT